MLCDFKHFSAGIGIKQIISPSSLCLLIIKKGLQGERSATASRGMSGVFLYGGAGMAQW